MSGQSNITYFYDREISEWNEPRFSLLKQSGLIAN